MEIRVAMKSSVLMKIRNGHIYLKTTFPTVYPNPLTFLVFMVCHPVLFVNKYLAIVKALLAAGPEYSRDMSSPPDVSVPVDVSRNPEACSEDLLQGVLPDISHDARPAIALQLDSFDKGGLEEVVLCLLRGLSRKGAFRVYLFLNDDTLGYLATKAQEEGFAIILLRRNEELLEALVQRLGIRLVNLHYSIFGTDTYARNGVRMVYTVHNNYIWATPPFIEQRKAAYRKMQKFIAVSDQVKLFFVTKFNVDSESVITVPNGLDISSLAHVEPVSRHEMNLQEGDFVFLNVSSFNWNKFHILMIMAMKQLVGNYPNFKLLLVGNIADAACYNYVLQEIKRNRLSNNIRIVEYMPKSRILGLMRIVDCFMLPSLVEGWSIAAMEAMYSELPLILSDIGSARNIISGADIGLIVPNPYKSINDMTPVYTSQRFTNADNLANLPDLCTCMVDMYDNKVAWQEKAQQGRQKIRDSFNVDIMTDRYSSLFESVLNEADKGRDNDSSQIPG